MLSRQAISAIDDRYRNALDSVTARRKLPAHQRTAATDGRAIGELRALIGEMLSTKDWRMIPRILRAAVHADPTVQAIGAESVSKALETVRLSEFPLLDANVRDGYIGWWYWNDLQPKDVSRRSWTPDLWLLLTMHNCGHIRELALQQFDSLPATPRMIAAALLRLNDWVLQVREVAVQVLHRLVVRSSASQWLEVLPVLFRLAGQTRADHTWIIREIEVKLLHPGNRSTLAHACHFGEPRQTRYAILIATRLDDTECLPFVDLALRSKDARIRLIGARRAMNLGNQTQRRDLCDRLSRDPLMDVRRISLRICLDQPPEFRRSRLLRFVADHGASVRFMARVHLRDDLASQGVSFDPRATYLDLLRTSIDRSISGAALGLGEVGDARDIEMLEPLLAHALPSIAGAAVRAISMLGGDARIPWLVDRLTDPRRAVSSAAARALRAVVSRCDADRLRSIADNHDLEHCRHLAWRLLLARRHQEAIVDACRGLTLRDEWIRDACERYVERFTRDFSAYPLTPEAAPRVLELIAAPGVRLPQRVRDVLVWLTK